MKTLPLTLWLGSSLGPVPLIKGDRIKDSDIEMLHQTLRVDKDVQKVLVSQGFEAEATTPEQFGQYITAEAEKWSPIVKASGMKVD